MMENNFIVNDENQIKDYLAFAKNAREHSSDENHYPDIIIEDNYNCVSSPHSKDNFISYLKLKYVYFTFIKKGKSEDDLFFEHKISDARLMILYKSIFAELSQDNGVDIETQRLLLRYTQLSDNALSFYYNDLPELRELLNLLLDSDDYRKLEKIYMGRHDISIFMQVDRNKLYEFLFNCSEIFTSFSYEKKATSDVYFKTFICLLAKYFDAQLVDHMRVYQNDDGSCKIEYDFISDENVRKAKDIELRINESYSKGEGISGSLLLINEKQYNFHVGTNNLRDDNRQSKTHLEKHNKLYGIEIENFWAFPYYDTNGNIIGAFRVINKITPDSNGEHLWNYHERATLLYIARWFECQWNGILKTLDANNNFSIKNNEIFYNSLGLNWQSKKLFDTIMIHLRTIVIKRIENHYIDACFGVYSEAGAKLFLEDKTHPEYQMKPVFYEGVEQVIFDKNKPKDVDKSVLDDISLLYKTIHPYTAFCLFSSNGKNGEFHGIRQLVIKAGDIPDINKIHEISKEDDSVIFLAQGEEKSIRIYMKQSLVADYYLSDSSGDWRFRLFSKFEDTLKKTNINSKIVKYICSVIFELSFKRIGSLLIFSDCFEPADKDKHNELLTDNYIEHINNSVFLGWASMDGAVICKSDGHVRFAGIILPKNPDEKPLPDYIDRLIAIHQKGSRHTTAAQYSRSHENDCVIVISQNKGISIFHKSELLVWDDMIKGDPEWPQIIPE